MLGGQWEVGQLPRERSSILFSSRVFLTDDPLGSIGTAWIRLNQIERWYALPQKLHSFRWLEFGNLNAFNA